MNKGKIDTCGINIGEDCEELIKDYLLGKNNKWIFDKVLEEYKNIDWINNSIIISPYFLIDCSFCKICGNYYYSDTIKYIKTYEWDKKRIRKRYECICIPIIWSHLMNTQTFMCFLDR